MVTTTRLRILRFRYNIALPELAEKIDISRQQLSRLELCIASPTAYQEKKIAEAIEKLITERKAALVELEHDYLLHKGRFLEKMEVPYES